MTPCPYLHTYSTCESAISACIACSNSCLQLLLTSIILIHTTLSRTSPQHSSARAVHLLRFASTSTNTYRLSKMRVLFVPLLLSPLAALAAPDIVAKFEPAVEQLMSVNNETAQDGSLELLKRQAGCAKNYYGCSNLNAPGLCCPKTAVCSADQAGQVACCPQGAACTGALGGAVTGSATQTAASTAPFVAASTTSNPFVQQTNGATSGSTVQNQFYPFPYIATTYTNAAACSSAYTSCQGDAARCTSDLANGAQGVTISAPNGGVTQTAIASVGLQSAASICSSLSSIACYELNVQACARFNGDTGAKNAAMRERCAGYFMTAGVAVGIAGQLLR